MAMAQGTFFSRLGGLVDHHIPPPPLSRRSANHISKKIHHFWRGSGGGCAPSTPVHPPPTLSFPTMPFPVAGVCGNAAPARPPHAPLTSCHCSSLWSTVKSLSHSGEGVDGRSKSMCPPPYRPYPHGTSLSPVVSPLMCSFVASQPHTPAQTQTNTLPTSCSMANILSHSPACDIVPLEPRHPFTFHCRAVLFMPLASSSESEATTFGPTTDSRAHNACSSTYNSYALFDCRLSLCSSRPPVPEPIVPLLFMTHIPTPLRPSTSCSSENPSA